MAITITILVLLLLVGGGVGVWYYIKKQQKVVDTVVPEVSTPPAVEIPTDTEEVIKGPSESIPEEDKPLEYITVNNQAIAKLAGSGHDKFETLEEIESRVSKLSREEFEKLNIEDRPWAMSQWNSVDVTDEEKAKRSQYEQSVLFRYDADGKEVLENVIVLTKKYPK